MSDTVHKLTQRKFFALVGTQNSSSESNQKCDLRLQVAVDYECSGGCQVSAPRDQVTALQVGRLLAETSWEFPVHPDTASGKNVFLRLRAGTDPALSRSLGCAELWHIRRLYMWTHMQTCTHWCGTPASSVVKSAAGFSGALSSSRGRAF